MGNSMGGKCSTMTCAECAGKHKKCKTTTMGRWVRLQTSGRPPSPRSGHDVAVIGNKVREADKRMHKITQKRYLQNCLDHNSLSQGVVALGFHLASIHSVTDTGPTSRECSAVNVELTGTPFEYDADERFSASSRAVIPPNSRGMIGLSCRLVRVSAIARLGSPLVRI